MTTPAGGRCNVSSSSFERSPAPIAAAKRLQGVGLRAVRGQPVGCLRWCGLGGIRPLHPWDRVLGRAEHRVGPQGAPSVVECVLLHQHPDVLTEGDTQRVGSNVHPRLHVLRHTSLHLDERGRCFPPSSSRTSCRHEHTVADKWAYLPHYRPACRTRGQPKVIGGKSARSGGAAASSDALPDGAAVAACLLAVG